MPIYDWQNIGCGAANIDNEAVWNTLGIDCAEANQLDAANSRGRIRASSMEAKFPDKLKI